jgi:hypothetical protein
MFEAKNKKVHRGVSTATRGQKVVSYVSSPWADALGALTLFALLAALLIFS